MKEFSCGAVVAGCQATFTAQTEEEMLAQVAQHAADEHGIEEVSPELVAQVKENIHEA